MITIVLIPFIYIHGSVKDMFRSSMYSQVYTYIIISPNEVFGDIMVLASPPRPRPHPRPPSPRVDPSDVNTLTRTIFNPSLSNII